MTEAMPEAIVAALIRRARTGDASAIEELFARSQPRLDTWASRYRDENRWRAGAGLDRPSDIAQETALRGFDRFSTFTGETEEEWYAWLKSIFERSKLQGIRDAQRKKRDARATLSLDRSEVRAVPGTRRSPSQAVAHHENWQQTLTHIYQLPDEQRDAIWLCHLKELPVAQVAQIMNKTEAAVAGLLRRGLATLRQRAAPGDGAPAGKGAPDAAAAILLVYLRRRDAGEVIDSDAFLAEYQDFRDELEPMLGWIEHIQGIRPYAP